MRALTTAAAPAAARPPGAAAVVQRRCACGASAGEREGRRALLPPRPFAGVTGPSPSVPLIVHEVLRSPGRPLDPAARAFFEPRFGHDFSRVRVHTDARAAESARAVQALAWTGGRDIAFAEGRYQPESGSGRRLLAHELAHVVQQGSGGAAPPDRLGPAESPQEREAEAAAEAVASAGAIPRIASAAGAIQRRPEPYIKQVTVHLTPPQSAELAWQGTPPATATGSDNFTVSTGKGYSDRDDPDGTCTRDCCGDPMTQCAPPYNRPEHVGACCTYFGSSFWAGVPRPEHNGWKFWTPIQPFYSTRGIALHQHTHVTGQPIGHGCVRMEEANAQRIAEFSNGRRTNVTIDGRAAPVRCEEARRCGPAARGGGPDGGGASLEPEGAGEGLAANVPAVPGLEGEMT
jgi:hypothetical protein